MVDHAYCAYKEKEKYWSVRDRLCGYKGKILSEFKFNRWGFLLHQLLRSNKWKFPPRIRQWHKLRITILQKYTRTTERIISKKKTKEETVTEKYFIMLQYIALGLTIILSILVIIVLVYIINEISQLKRAVKIVLHSKTTKRSLSL